MQRRWIVRSPADLGRAIAEIRHQRAMTQTEVAEVAGLSRDWLAKLESGRSSILLTRLLGVLRRLGATVTITFDDGDRDAP